MWNLLHLKCPAQEGCEYNREENSNLDSFQELIHVLSSGADILMRDHPIWTEMKIFSSIQSRYKMLLHCDKLLYLIQRVSRCLKKMVLLNLSKSYLDLSECLINSLQDPNTVILLPSRQHLEYVLIRTQSTSKLILDALEYSRETFCYLVQKLKIGHLLTDLLMATSVTARLHIMFKGILLQIFDLYKKLFPWLKKLKKGSYEWPSSLVLPKDLEEWLQPQHFDAVSESSTSESQINVLASYFSKKVEDQSDETETQLVPDLDSEESGIIDNSIQQFDEDYGEVAPRKKTSVESPQCELTMSKKIILKKIFKAKTLKKLQTVWDHINSTADDLSILNLTQKKINKVNTFMEKIKKPAEISKVPISHGVKFRFMKCLGMLKNKEEYFHWAKVILKQKKESVGFKPVKRLKELRLIFEEMCKRMINASEFQKLEKMTKYYQGQLVAIKELKNDNCPLTRKLTFVASKVLIQMFNAE